MAQFACEVLKAAGLGRDVGVQTAADLGLPAARPAWSVLDTSKLTEVRGKPLPAIGRLTRHLPLDEQAARTATSLGCSARQATLISDCRTSIVSKILVTGGAGFIGSNFVRMLLAETDHRVVNLDLLTYAGNLENLSGVDQDEAYAFVRRHR